MVLASGRAQLDMPCSDSTLQELCRLQRCKDLNAKARSFVWVKQHILLGTVFVRVIGAVGYSWAPLLHGVFIAIMQWGPGGIWGLQAMDHHHFCL